MQVVSVVIVVVAVSVAANAAVAAAAAGSAVGVAGDYSLSFFRFWFAFVQHAGARVCVCVHILRRLQQGTVRLTIPRAQRTASRRRSVRSFRSTRWP